MVKNKYKVVIPEHIKNKLKTLPKKDKKIIKTAIDDVASGKIRGDIMAPKKIPRLRCNNCDSGNIMWFIDDNSKEVYYSCSDCHNSGWMYEHEYNRAVKKYKDKILPDVVTYPYDMNMLQRIKFRWFHMCPTLLCDGFVTHTQKQKGIPHTFFTTSICKRCGTTIQRTIIG